MFNKSMERSLKNGDCLDVNKVGERMPDGTFKLRGFIEDIDYCDAKNEKWIWTIGKHIETGEIRASLDTRFYDNPAYECLFLR